MLILHSIFIFRLKIAQFPKKPEYFTAKYNLKIDT